MNEKRNERSATEINLFARQSHAHVECKKMVNPRVKTKCDYLTILLLAEGCFA